MIFMKISLLNLFGLGKTKFSASTASLLVLPLYWCIGSYLTYAFIINLAFFFIVLGGSMYLLHTNKNWAMSDPKEIVVDEFLGMHIALIIAASLNVYILLAQFILFRVIDILKPFPFSWIEKKCNNEYGLLADDIAIGIVIGFATMFFR